MRKSLEDKIKKIRMVAMDVDGVLTRGEVIFLPDGNEVKIWNVKDRMGFSLARRAGNLKLAWITGRGSKEVERSAEEVKIDFLFQQAKVKIEPYCQMLEEFSLQDGEVAYIGDDLIDLPLLRRVGWAVCPCDAPMEIKKEVDYVTKARGGEGVFREVIEIILKIQDSWEKVTERYYKYRNG